MLGHLFDFVALMLPLSFASVVFGQYISPKLVVLFAVVGTALLWPTARRGRLAVAPSEGLSSMVARLGLAPVVTLIIVSIVQMGRFGMPSESIDGNPVRSDGTLSPERCLRVLCLMRLVNPRAEIRVAAGREGHLRGLQALALWPANSLFVDGYLTTRGDALADTYRMIRDAGFEVDGNPLSDGTQVDETGGFRLAGQDGEILRPEIRRNP